MAPRQRRVVVIGASMAGLLAARALADVAGEVLILDRDALRDSARARKGFPQGRHAHALLRTGELVLQELFPGLIEDLVAGGAQRLWWLADCRWWQFDGYRVRHGEDFQGTFLTRPYLVDAVRRRVTALPNVELQSGTRVRQLIADDHRVSGVAVDTDAEASTIRADFVVDATGRGSQVGTWLETLGCPAPRIDHVRIDMGYASRLLRRSPASGPDDWRWATTIGTPSRSKRLAILIPVEGARWMVTLAGFFGDHAPTDEAGFLAFVESLATDDIASVLRVAEPLSPIVTHRLPSEQWRHFERLRRPPAGFVAIGDSICSFNPIYGQGMSSAALQALGLRRCVDRYGVASADVPRRFCRAAAKVVSSPWQVAVGGDYFYAETTGRRPRFVDTTNRYVRKASVASQHDPVVASAMANVQNLLAAPQSLMRPAIMRRVLRAARATGREPAPESRPELPAVQGFTACVPTSTARDPTLSSDP